MLPVRVKALNIFLTVVFITMVVGYISHLKNRALYNSDMLPYMGIVLQMQGYDAKQIHDSVYAITKASVPVKNFTLLTQLNQGRIDRFNDHVLFYEYLNFFRLKPLYVFLIRIFNSIGVNLVFATLLPSLIFTAGVLMVFYAGLGELFISSIIPFFVGVVILMFGFTNELAVISTPDAMSTFVVLILFLNIFFSGKEFVSYCILTLAILTRLDNLTLLPFILYYYRMGTIDTKILVNGAILLVAITIVVLVFPYFFGNNLMWFKDFIFKPSAYIKLVSKSAALMRTDFNLLFLLFMGLFYVGIQNNDRIKTLFTGTVLAMLTRFLLFPSYEERFYFIFKLILLFLVFAHYAKKSMIVSSSINNISSIPANVRTENSRL